MVGMNGGIRPGPFPGSVMISNAPGMSPPSSAACRCSAGVVLDGDDGDGGDVVFIRDVVNVCVLFIGRAGSRVAVRAQIQVMKPLARLFCCCFIILILPSLSLFLSFFLSLCVHGRIFYA